MMGTFPFSVKVTNKTKLYCFKMLFEVKMSEYERKSRSWSCHRNILTCFPTSPPNKENFLRSRFLYYPWGVICFSASTDWKMKAVKQTTVWHWKTWVLNMLWGVFIGLQCHLLVWSLMHTAVKTWLLTRHVFVLEMNGDQIFFVALPCSTFYRR